MPQGHNYLTSLQRDYAVAKARARSAEARARSAETEFSRALPVGYSTLDRSEDLPPDPEIMRKREAFRTAHAVLCRLRSELGEVEEELFPFAGDRH